MNFGRVANHVDDDSEPEGDAPAALPRAGGANGGVNEAAAATGPVDDSFPSPNIKGSDGQYPLLPPEHFIRIPKEGFEPVPCRFGGVRHITGSDEWKRLEISNQERKWKSCVSANFRVVENDEPNTTRHLYHAGPHVSMVFDITQQNTPEAGDKTIKTICFLTQQVNSSMDLRGCIVGTHFTSLDINHAKGKAVRGLFWHGGRSTGGAPLFHMLWLSVLV